MDGIVEFLNRGIDRRLLIREADGRHAGFFARIVQIHLADLMASALLYQMGIDLKLPLIAVDPFLIPEKIWLPGRCINCLWVSGTAALKTMHW